MDKSNAFLSTSINIYRSMTESNFIKKYPYIFYMIFAHFAYRPDAEINLYLRNTNIKYHPYAVNNECVMIFETNDSLIVSFRGTVPTNIHNIKTIMEFEETDYYGFKIHKGFADYSRTIEPYVRPIVEASKKQVFFVGHSLGGALASLGNLYCEPTGIFTYGCPRYVQKTENFPDQNITNIKNGDDIVTFLPPFIYKRVGNEIEIPSITNFIFSHFNYYYFKSLFKFYKLKIL